LWKLRVDLAAGLVGEDWEVGARLAGLAASSRGGREGKGSDGGEHPERRRVT
jgi:hypothetical protein